MASTGGRGLFPPASQMPCKENQGGHKPLIMTDLDTFSQMSLNEVTIPFSLTFPLSLLKCFILQYAGETTFSLSLFSFFLSQCNLFLLVDQNTFPRLPCGWYVCMRASKHWVQLLGRGHALPFSCLHVAAVSHQDHAGEGHPLGMTKQ